MARSALNWLRRLAAVAPLLAAAAAAAEPDTGTVKWLFNVKLVLVFVVGVATLLASLLPWWIAAHLGSRRSLDAISCASALSAGVVLGALLTHMLPESAESFDAYLTSVYEEGSKIAGYPFPGLVCGCVFLVLVGVDVLVVRRGADGHSHHSHGGDGGGHDHISESLSLLKARHTAATTTLEMRPVHATATGGGGDETGADGAPPSPGFGSSGKSGGGYGAIAHAGHAHGAAAAADGDSDADSEAEAEAAAHATQRTVRAYVFFAALSLHGVFDGLSVGSEDQAASFTSTAVAVLSHKLFDGLALGCALFPLGLAAAHRWVLLVACALTTPLGIGAGLAAEAAVDGTSVRLVNGVFLAAASGSFMFISLTELWPSSVSDGRLVPLKLGLFTAGFATMAVLAAYV